MTTPKNLADLLFNRPASDAVLIADGREWTAGELCRAAMDVENRLRAYGVQTGDRVVLEISSSAEWVVAAFAVWRMGALTVPIQDRPEKNSGSFAKDCRAAAGLRVLEGVGKQSERPFDAETIVIVPAVEPLESMTKEREQAVVDFDAESPAAIYFTSGTTGEPLGVVLTHRNLLSNAVAVAASLELMPEDRAFLALPLGYIFGLSVLLSHWVVCGTVVLEKSFVFPAASLEKIAQAQATVFYGVSSHYAALCRWGGIAGSYRGSLRLLAQAGDRMPLALLQKLRETFGACQIRLMYGQTEAAPRIACAGPSDALLKPGSVGKPIPGVQIKIINEQGMISASGETGEIVVQGPGVMRGYWNDPRRTEEALCGGWLHTGDLGYLDPEGCLYVEGRKSGMTKVHGLWVSVKKLEEVCLSFEGIQEALIRIEPDPITGLASIQARLHAAGQVNENAFILFLRAHLKPHEIPTKIIWES